MSKNRSPDQHRGDLISLLQLAYSGERAAGYAYRGHWHSVSDSDERRRIESIENEEWHHRQLVGDILRQLGAGPSEWRETKSLVIGRVLSVLCHLSGWMAPMYGAGKLESRNIREYETAARLAWLCGRTEFVECLLAMAEVEWEHERYFRNRVLSRRLGRLLPMWPLPPSKENIRTSFSAFLDSAEHSRQNPGQSTIPRRKTMNRIAGFLAVISLLAGAAYGQTTPVPKVTGPIPVTADSYPFLAANKNTDPMDLPKFGYVEEEFIVSGAANVYDWNADGSTSVKTPNVPYGARILVRRPSDAARFNGAVVVELMFAARRYDWPIAWGYAHQHFVESGFGWVGITMPASSDGLKKFNPTRYAGVSFANPAPNVPCGNNPAPAFEEGLRFDAISQIGALLKSGAGSPFGNLRVEALYMFTQGGDITTYINAIHSNANLANGKSVYDGYVVRPGFAPVRINACAAAPAAGDPRRAIKKISAPVIIIAAQGEVPGVMEWRQPDSDEAIGRFRLYEVAGASHIDKAAYSSFAPMEDQAKTGGNVQGTKEFPLAGRCDPEYPLPARRVFSYIYDSTFTNIDQWVRKGTPAPRSVQMQTTGTGAQAKVALDQHGNGLGGIRTPYVDVPAETFVTNSVGPGPCGEMGHSVPFDWAKLEALYGNQKNYAAKVNAAVDKAVRERWFTEADGRRVKTELVAPPPGSN